MKVFIGKWTETELDRIIRGASEIRDAGERIAVISREFLGIDYRENTLIGGRNMSEVLVVNLGGVDCFTFIDYVEAMRISASFLEFISNLQKIRYKRGRIAFEDRNHFFTDWREFNTALVRDVTHVIGGASSIKVGKTLNAKEDGSVWVASLEPVRRAMEYIPSPALDEELLNRLQTGDYAGIYSEAPGLDVSHVGIVINDKGKVLIRHASSLRKKVVDEDLAAYLSGKSGLIVLRPK